MKLLSLTFIAVWMCYAQSRGNPSTTQQTPDENDLRLSQTQREALIKADHKRNVEDVETLFKLAEELKADLVKEDPHVISVRSIKKTEDIEKLAKSIRGRLKRY